MQIFGKARVGAISVILATLMLPALAPSPAFAAINLDAEEAAFCTLINQYRATKGLPPLMVSERLTNSSVWYSADMANKNYTRLDHVDSLGRTIKQRIEAFGYTYNTYWGENIAWGFATGKAAFDWWKNSPSHNANMLNANFKVLGIGKASNFSSAWSHYWTTDFGGYVDPGAIPCPGGGGGGSTTSPAVSVVDVSTVEGNSSIAATKVMNFKIKIPVAAKTPVTVTYVTSNGSATAGSDYLAVTGVATIASGTRIATISVSIVKDRLKEANETVNLTISSPVNGTLGDASAVGTITNDD
ncbi:MAG TPA: CAP domain-containing protein [Actinomycetota bacterium]|nr:CAP domain-containing protein [Actinomycetota bacterium]